MLPRSSSDDGTVRVWDPQTGTSRGILCGHLDWVRALAATVSHDRRPRLVSGSDDKSVALWDPIAKVRLRSFRGHSAAVNCVAAWAGGGSWGAYLVSGSLDTTVRVWRLDAGRGEHVVLRGHSHAVTGVAVVSDASDGNGRVASGALDASLKLWDVETGAEVGTAPIAQLPYYWAGPVDRARPMPHWVYALSAATSTHVAVATYDQDWERPRDHSPWTDASFPESCARKFNKPIRQQSYIGRWRARDPQASMASWFLMQDLPHIETALDHANCVVRLFDAATGDEVAALSADAGSGGTNAIACFATDRSQVNIAVAHDSALLVFLPSSWPPDFPPAPAEAADSDEAATPLKPACPVS